jgi:squalene-associated FAD-dependent desaturase
MAAAVTLAQGGIPVTVYEAARTLGGRARRVSLGGTDFDNGQHILLGAYRETLELMRTVGADPDRLLRRMPLEVLFADGFHLRASRLPHPVNLLVALFAAKGLDFAGAFEAARFVARLRRHEFRVAPDRSVDQLLRENGQGAIIRSHLWEPLCVSALNTPVARASAQTFANVLRDSLGGSRTSSDLLLALTDLSRLFPEPAAEYIRSRNGSVVTGSPVRSLAKDDRGFRLDDRPQRYSGVIVACAPQHAPPLLAAFPELVRARRLIERFEYEPIVTCYLRYPRSVPFSAPMLGFTGGILQWVFDRSRPGSGDSLLAAVISASGVHEELDRESLARRIDAELRAALPALPTLASWEIIAEKRATFSCRPGIERPDGGTPLRGLTIAGDYVAGPHPATIEGAVRSGIASARLTLEQRR